MIRTYGNNIELFGDNGEHGRIDTSPDYLELYTDFDDFIEDVKEKYTWISSNDIEQIFYSIGLRF